jgi:hypothetical protein
MYRAELGRSYGRVLEWPTPIVLVLLWVAGVMLEGLCAVTLYVLYRNGMVLAERLLEGSF